MSKILLDQDILSNVGEYILKPLENNIDTNQIKKFIISKIPKQDTKTLIKQLESDIDKVIKHKQQEIDVSYHNWSHAGWFRVQKGSIKNIYNNGGIGVCYCCNNSFKNYDDVVKCNYAFILSAKALPKFLSSNFTRLFLVCLNCENNAKVLSPPKSWQEALIISIYNESENKLKSIVDYTVKEELIKSMNQKYDDLLEKENKLMNQVKDTENNILKLEIIIKDYEKISADNSKLLHDMVKNKKSCTKLLEEDDTYLRNAVYNAKQLVIKERNRFNEELDSMKNQINTQIEDIYNTYSKSSLGRLESSLKSVDENICQVCYDNKINILLSPCGHMVICDNCMNFIDNNCPLCRTPITDKTKIFRS
jgi:hypothetical protein